MTAAPATEDAAAAPLSLRLAVTSACDLRCIYCTPGSSACSNAAYDRVSLDELLWFVRTTQQLFPVHKVHLTGGEPLMRDGLVALIHALTATGVPDLALTTNGQRLCTLAPALAYAGLRRVNISLDSLRPAVYTRITRGGHLQPVLDGIAAARAAGLAVKLNMVVLRSCNDDDIISHAHFALQHGCDIRYLELMPIGCARALFAAAHMPAADIIASLATTFTLSPLPPRASQHQQFLLSNGGAACTAGIIASVSQPFCAGCRRLRLTADGMLLGCLARSHTIDILPLLRTRDQPGLLHALNAALHHKRHDTSFDQPSSMIAIGG